MSPIRPEPHVHDEPASGLDPEQRLRFRGMVSAEVDPAARVPRARDGTEAEAPVPTPPGT
jgi:hypothetical protein